MIKPGNTEHEEERLRALGNYGIVNTRAEAEYDDVALIAKEICKTDVALVSFIDRDTQWFKAHPGTELDRNTRELALCAHAILHARETMYIEDTRKDERFQDNPMVTGPTQVHFYAGVPILSPEGLPLGTVCVMHTTPMTLEDWQLQSLERLTRQVEQLVELRKRNKELTYSKRQLRILNDELNDFASAVSHDIKEPLYNITQISKMLIDEKGDLLDEEAMEFVHYSIQAASKLREMVDDMLAYYRNAHLPQSETEFEFESLANDIMSLHDPAGEFQFSVDVPGPTLVTNRSALEIVVGNLVTNAMKYNDKEEKKIEFTFQDCESHYRFTVKDNGRGIDSENSEKIFERFNNLERFDRKNRLSTGLGLSLILKVIHHMSGEIHVDSKPGIGSSFTFTFTKALKS